MTDGFSMIPLMENFHIKIPNCFLYGTAFEIIKDRLILVSAAWNFRNGRNFVSGLGYYSKGLKYQCIGMYLDMVRTDGKPKTKWNMRIVLLENNCITELSQYQCPSTFTIDDPIENTEDILLGHIVDKFKTFLVKNHVDESLFASFDRILKSKNITWVQETKAEVKETKVKHNASAEVQAKLAEKAKKSSDIPDIYILQEKTSVK